MVFSFLYKSIIHRIIELCCKVLIYVNEVHGTLVGEIGQAVSELADRAMVYESGFTEIDGSDDAHITQESLEEVQKRVEGNMEAFAGEVGSLSDILYSVSDLFASALPSTESVSNNYDAIRETTTNLNQSTGSYEASHLGDCANINGMLESVLSIISAQSAGTISVNNYSAGKIANLDAFRTLQESYGASVQYYSDNMQQIADAHENIASKIEAEIAAAEKAAAEERARKGFWDAAAAIGTMAIGAAAIICTGGAATPLVVAAGVSAVAYGASNLGEAGQDVYYGLKGDAQTKSFNLLRDTVFMGNQTVYDIWGSASTAMSLGFAFAGAGTQAAVQAGSVNPLSGKGITLALKGNAKALLHSSVPDIIKGAAKFTGKTILTVGTGVVTEKIITPFTSEDFGRLAGIIAAGEVANKTFTSKISKWDDCNKPRYDQYMEHKAVYDNPKYYNQNTGETIWPPNDGAAGEVTTTVLPEGTRIDRYGSDFGTYTSPEGTPYEMRSVAPGTDQKPYSVFEVQSPLEVQSSEVAPWFDQPGGGIQYKLPESVDDLLEAGIIRRVK